MLALLLLFSAGASAQTRIRATVVGRVLDAETKAAVENANAFLANTACGASTVSDGTFILSNIPPGSYELVVSRVGYLRKTEPITINSPDTLSIAITLVPRSIPLSAPDIVAEGGRTDDLNRDVFFPQPADDAYCLYGSEVSFPVGILFTDSALFMYALEPAVIDSERFFRLWLLIYNTATAPMEFDATRSVRLNVHNAATEYLDIRPNQPERDFPEVQDSVTSRIVSRTVRTTLEVVSHQREYFIGRSVIFEWQNGGPWLGKNAPADFVSGLNPTHLLRIYNDCRYGGTLQHYRISPASGVHGYLYFPAPGLRWRSSPAVPSQFAYTRVTLMIRTPSGTRTLAFNGQL